MGKSKSSQYSKSKVYRSSFTSKSKSMSKPRETPVNFTLPNFRFKSTRKKQNVSLYNPVAEQARQQTMADRQRENTNAIKEAKKEAKKQVDEIDDLFSNLAVGKSKKPKHRRRRKGTRKK